MLRNQSSSNWRKGYLTLLSIGQHNQISWRGLFSVTSPWKWLQQNNVSVPFYMLIVHAASSRGERVAIWGGAAGALADSAATQPDTSISSPPPSPPYISLHILFSLREKKKIKGAWWGPLLSENFPSDLLDLGGKCCTICASFAITGTLSSKQMTLNDSSLYEEHKGAHEQNKM